MSKNKKIAIWMNYEKNKKIIISIVLFLALLLYFLITYCSGGQETLYKNDNESIFVAEENLVVEEEIVVEEGKDKLLVSITKQFPTPNFAMAVEKIVANKGQYEIYIITAPPKEDIQLQVIRYKTIYLEIDKDDIGKPPYKFVM